MPKKKHAEQTMRIADGERQKPRHLPRHRMTITLTLPLPQDAELGVRAQLPPLLMDHRYSRKEWSLIGRVLAYLFPDVESHHNGHIQQAQRFINERVADACGLFEGE